MALEIRRSLINGWLEGPCQFSAKSAEDLLNIFEGFFFLGPVKDAKTHLEGDGLLHLVVQDPFLAILQFATIDSTICELTGTEIDAKICMADCGSCAKGRLSVSSLTGQVCAVPNDLWSSKADAGTWSFSIKNSSSIPPIACDF